MEQFIGKRLPLTAAVGPYTLGERDRITATLYDIRCAATGVIIMEEWEGPLPWTAINAALTPGCRVTLTATIVAAEENFYGIPPGKTLTKLERVRRFIGRLVPMEAPAPAKRRALVE